MADKAEESFEDLLSEESAEGAEKPEAGAEKPAPQESPKEKPEAEPEKKADTAVEEPERPKEETAEPAPKAPASPVPGLTLDDWKAHLDEREKRQLAQAEAETLKRRLAELEQQKTEEKPPDPIDDPDAYRSYLNDRFEQRLVQERMTMSGFMAVEKYGEETVTKAVKWAAALPQHQVDSLQNQPMPVVAAVEAWRREQASERLKEHGGDLDAFVKAEVEKALAAKAGASPQTASDKDKLPPKIINSGGAETKPVEQTEEAFFESVFIRQ